MARKKRPPALPEFPPEVEHRLTFKQELFISSYLGVAKGNGSLAAKMAGYAGDENALGAIAYETLRKPYIQARVDGRLAAAKASSDEILIELTEIAFAPWREFVDVKMDKEGSVVSAQVILKDKIRALELLGKYHALFVDVSATRDIPKDVAGLKKHIAAEMERVFGPAAAAAMLGRTVPSVH